jgi:hypothetical protein
MYNEIYMEESTILLNKKVIEMLKAAKEHPKQTYNELLEKMAEIIIKLKERNQYDEFLHKIQQPKMKEIWDNKEDEAWDNIK